MKFLLLLLVSLFISQLMLDSVQSFCEDSQTELACDLQEENGDNEEEVEMDEWINASLRHDKSLQYRCESTSRVEFDVLQKEYAEVYRTSPYSPPDVFTSF